MSRTATSGRHDGGRGDFGSPRGDLGSPCEARAKRRSALATSAWRATSALLAVAVAALGLTASGCYSKATGYHGKFTFAYAAGANFDNFVKPIAPGAKLDVVAFANGTDDELEITRATSSRPGVLTIASVHGHVVTLAARQPGVADIEITARDASGNTLVDTMFLHVDRPVVHALEDACGVEGGDAVYVRGDSPFVYHGLATRDGRPVIGYGYAPLRVEPASALELIPSPQGATYYAFRTLTTTPKVTVRSTIDDSAVSLRVVERGDLKEAALECPDDCRVFEGSSRYVFAMVSLGGAPVCSQNALTKARTTTPEICAVSAKLEDDDGSETNHEQLAIVTGKKFGICKYEIELPELAGGRGIKLAGEVKVGRMEFPGDRGSGARAPASDPPSDRRALWWSLLAIGWIAPNVLVLGCALWLRRRRSSAGAGSAKKSE